MGWAFYYKPPVPPPRKARPAPLPPVCRDGRDDLPMGWRDPDEMTPREWFYQGRREGFEFGLCVGMVAMGVVALVAVTALRAAGAW